MGKDIVEPDMLFQRCKR